MKKKKFISLICCLLLCMGVLSLTCYADSNKNDSMVYASGEQLDQIYELLQKDSYNRKKLLEVNSLTIVKESITPVYTVDLVKYAETGKMSVVPMWRGNIGCVPSEGSGNVYVAKTITSDKQYGGNIMFYIENGVAYNLEYSPSKYSPMWDEGGSYPASSSYADHATRISSALKEPEFVSVYDVKYVYISEELGGFFHISNNDHDIFFSIGYVSVETSNKSTNNVDYSIEPNELLNYAKDYSAKWGAYLKEKAEWAAAHPGEIWDRTGDVEASPIITECSHIDNVLDIASYLNIDYTLASNHNQNDSDIGFSIDSRVIFSLVFIAIILTFSIIFTVLRTKKNGRKSI